jgi:hypothetical protein
MRHLEAEGAPAASAPQSQRALPPAGAEVAILTGLAEMRRLIIALLLVTLAAEGAWFWMLERGTTWSFWGLLRFVFTS